MSIRTDCEILGPIQYCYSIEMKNFSFLLTRLEKCFQKTRPHKCFNYELCTCKQGCSEGGLRGAEPPLLKFHGNLGVLSPPLYFFADCVTLILFECSVKFM